MKLRVADYMWEHPLFRGHTRDIPAGKYLFHQGETGGTLFILVRGIGALLAKRQGREYLVDVIEAGEFLGEKAILAETPHERFFSAKAVTQLTVVELGLRDIEQIQKANPALITDLMKQMFQLAVQRMHRSNEVIAALRSSNNAHRFIQFVMLMARESAENTPNGQEIFLNMEKVQYYVDMNHFETEQCIHALLENKILVRKRGDVYLLKNPQALRDAASSIEDKLPYLKAI